MSWWNEVDWSGTEETPNWQHLWWWWLSEWIIINVIESTALLWLIKSIKLKYDIWMSKWPHILVTIMYGTPSGLSKIVFVRSNLHWDCHQYYACYIVMCVGMFVFEQTRLMNQKKLRKQVSNAGCRIYTGSIDCLVQVCVYLTFSLVLQSK